jgi:hypothetical protein
VIAVGLLARKHCFYKVTCGAPALLFSSVVPSAIVATSQRTHLRRAKATALPGT